MTPAANVSTSQRGMLLIILSVVVLTMGQLLQAETEMEARSARFCAIEHACCPGAIRDLQAGSARSRPKQPARCSACPG